MYDLKMLEEIKSQEERIHFSSFDYNDAYTLGTMLRERGLTTPKPIAIRIVFDDIILYQSFLPGTNESNNQWMNASSTQLNAVTLLPCVQLLSAN